MLHELLFALNGFPGYTFMLSDGKFKVLSSVTTYSYVFYFIKPVAVIYVFHVLLLR